MGSTLSCPHKQFAIKYLLFLHKACHQVIFKYFYLFFSFFSGEGEWVRRKWKGHTCGLRVPILHLILNVYEIKKRRTKPEPST